ncbi:MAG: GGDEF domain-containing protein [Deltaproteobacteria bacterium]|nr:GGDEF domain-containing protein [Deltaproteobacteria bacterium]
MTSQQQSSGIGSNRRPDHLSAILDAPVATDQDTIRKYVPVKVRTASWWERTTDEQKATVIRSIICLKLKGFSDADVADLRTAVFRMFLWGKVRNHGQAAHELQTHVALSNVTPITRRRSPKNRELREKIDRLKRVKGLARLSRQELIEMATHDELTGLPNRHAFEMACKKPVVALADLEGLKWINDNIGHSAGDELIRRAADVFGENGLDAYRMGKGADEFIAQFATVEEADSAMAEVNESLRRSPIRAEGREVQGFQLSWGIGPDPKSADTRMNAAKTELQQAGLRALRGEQPIAFTVSPYRIPSNLTAPAIERRSA